MGIEDDREPVPDSGRVAESRASYGDAPPRPFPYDPVIEAYKRDVDRTMLRENLRLTPHRRAENMIRALRLADEFRRAGAAARSPERR
jgi:hypothetical protein